MIKTSLLLSFYLLVGLLQSQGPLVDYRFAKRLEPAALQEDFEMFSNSLLQYHPGLITYTSYDQICSALLAIETQLDHPMSDLEFYQLLSPLKSLIKDGHTYYYPNQNTRNQIRDSSSLPFQAFWDWKSLWVRQVYDEDADLKAGDKIIIINGLTAKEVTDHLMSNIIRDGENDTYPRWIMNQWFNEIYHYHFPIPEHWEIELMDAEGKKRKLTLANKPRISVPEEGEKEKEKEKGIYLRYEGEVGILKVASFNVALLKERYQQKFRPAIKEIFETLDENKAERLILDLRDNQGGEINNGRYLLSYLLEERFKLVQALKKVAASAEEIVDKRLKDKSIANLSWTKPKPNRFEGELIVLMNGGSFSCSGAVLAQLKAANRAIFVGEGAAGNRRVFCGVGKTELLPNSKISLSVPRVQFRIVDHTQNVGQGVMPDHYVDPTITDLIAGRDVELEKALSLFGENR